MYPIMFHGRISFMADVLRLLESKAEPSILFRRLIAEDKVSLSFPGMLKRVRLYIPDAVEPHGYLHEKPTYVDRTRAFEYEKFVEMFLHLSLKALKGRINLASVAKNARMTSSATKLEF